MIESQGFAEVPESTSPLARAFAGVEGAIGRLEKRIDVLANRLSPLAVVRDSTGVEGQPESIASEVVMRVRRHEKSLNEIDARLDDLIESLEL